MKSEILIHCSPEYRSGDVLSQVLAALSKEAKGPHIVMQCVRNPVGLAIFRGSRAFGYSVLVSE